VPLYGKIQDKKGAEKLQARPEFRFTTSRSVVEMYLWVFRERSQKTPMTHFVNRVTLSDLYQSDDPNVNKQVLKNLITAKKESANFYRKF